MSREFEVVVTDEMWDSILKDNGCVFLQNVFSTPDFQRQLRAYVAEQMRGLVPKERTKCCMNCAEHGECRPNNIRGCGNEDSDKEIEADFAHNACRAETLANIERWEQSHEGP